jgi:hypothetical protein
MPAPLAVPLVVKGAALAGKLIPTLGKILGIAKTGKVLGPAAVSAGLQVLGGRDPVDIVKDTALDIGLSATGIGVLGKLGRLQKVGSPLRKTLLSKGAKEAVTYGTSIVGVPLVGGAIDTVAGGLASAVGLGGGDIEQNPGTLNPANLGMTTVPQASAVNAQLVPGGNPASDTIIGSYQRQLMDDLISKAYSGGLVGSMSPTQLDLGGGYSNEQVISGFGGFT